MISSLDIPVYTKQGFDGPKYQRIQAQAIEERMLQFEGGKLYLEIGGKFLYDPHAARVLPGFDPKVKKEIFASLIDQAEILFCVNAQDIEQNRQLSNKDIDYIRYCEDMISDIENELGIKTHIVMNMMDPFKPADSIMSFQRELQKKGYRVRERYSIEGYPEDLDHILSEDGYGQDDHIPLEKNLILVTGAASNSGKLSTCLGQIYQDNEIWLESGYAKYETFPIRNLSLDHPVNLAYEAATADIGDYNIQDHYHQEHYGISSVNYNRDVDAFQIVKEVAQQLDNNANPIRDYKSPTDMGINTAGGAIIDDEVVCQASLAEIQRRKIRYKQMLDRGEGQQSRLDRCDYLESKAIEYMKYNNYEIITQQV
jgi:uncharacterized protein (UPF0371 family)